MILHSEAGYPDDIRVTKEIGALVNAGYEVHLLCQCRTGQKSYEKLGSGVHVHRVYLEHANSPADSISGKLHTLVKNIRIQRPRDEWRDSITRFTQDAQIDVLHCHDLPALPVACEVARVHSIPIVADLHENWPGFTITDIHQLPTWKKVLRRRLYRQWKMLEREFLPQCSRVVVVVEEAAQRVRSSCSVQPENLVVVSNTEDTSTLDVQQIPFNNLFPERWTATYVGGIGPHRGIDTSIRAAAIAGPKIPDFQLAIVGPSPLQIPRLKRMIEDAAADRYITIVPKVPSTQVPDYIRSSKVCLVPHNDTEHTNTTVPHKLFQYMLLEKPVLVSDCPPLERIVSATECGTVFHRNDAPHMAEQLIHMASDSAQLATWAKNGARAASNEFSWSKDAVRLIDMYESIKRAA